MAEGKLEFYCGSLGSGKTSFAVERALEHLIRGGTVVSNIEFYPDKVAAWMADNYGLKFDPDRLVKVEDGRDVWRSAVVGSDELETMLLIDEAHVEHNARAWDKTESEHIMFNTMARKLKIHVVYITQDINNVDKQFRRMAQMMWFCRNARHMRLFGLFSFPFNLFFRVPYVCGPGIPPKAMQPEVSWRPASWGLFNSHSLVGRALETFSILKSAKSSPLERVPRPRREFRAWLWCPAVVVVLLFLL